MAKYLLLVLILSQLVLPSTTALGAETKDKVVTGTVRNATPGGEAVGQLEVMLKTFDKDKEAGSLNAKTDSGGAFRFPNVPHASGWMHNVSTRFLGVEYVVQAFSIPDDQESKDVELLVYELTDSDKAIKIDRAHTVVDVDPESQDILVLEYATFINSGDRTFSGVKATGDGKTTTVRLSTPAGAQDLRGKFGRDELVLLDTKDGFSTTHPVPPGATDVTLSYRLPYKSSEYTISRSSRYQTNFTDVFVGDIGASVTVKGVMSKGPFEAEKRKYLYFFGQDLAADTDLTISLSNLPMKSPYPVWLWPAFAVVPVGAAVAFVYVKARARPAAPAATSVRAPQATDLPSRRRSLLTEIAELDDRREAGAISEPEYRALRLQKKARLMALVRDGQPAREEN